MPEHKRIRILASLLLGGFLSACALLKPLPRETSLQDRLALFPRAGLPLQGRVAIHWNDHQIPFIEAEHDDDAAFALGLVHAHLRLGQMQIYRHVAQGRIAEIGGPLAADIDHGLRILDYGRAAKEIEASMPEDTRHWVESFVAGVNHYQQTVRPLPVEYDILGLEPEPWTVADVLTFGRLAGTDVNWLVWFNLLKLRERDDWPRIWARLVSNGSASVPSFDGSTDEVVMNELLAGLSRSGSNSLAIAPGRTATGAAILANDPHLGINLPNTWLLAGIKSPTYHAVGLMVPGLPLFAIGRNPWIAWGGTNMRSASSDLYDVSSLDPDQVRLRKETIRVRWWFDREVTVRETPWGPILSDAPQLEDLKLPDLALRWTGHQASDETTAMLRVARARGFEEFRGAFETFAVPGQNMLYADHAGTIGQVMAVRIPDRTGPPPDDMVVQPEQGEPAWQTIKGVMSLPFSVNPERGFLASANNRPAETATQIGYFFSPDDRVRRMEAILDRAGTVDLDQVKAIQQDVYVESSVALRDQLVGAMIDTGVAAAAGGRQHAVLELMRKWDGHYRIDSRGAVAFELFRAAFTAGFYESLFGEANWAAFANVGRIKSLLVEDIEGTDPGRLATLLRSSLDAAAEHIDDFSEWGDMHRLGLAHPLQFLPLIGGRFHFADDPIAGSTDALMKTAHATTSEKHFVRYGSNARHISDLSDMDRNYFLLLGGQDGWFNSSTFLDQLPLWLEGTYIELPLRIETVRARFPHLTELFP